MKRLTRSAFIVLAALMLVSLLTACAYPIGTRNSTGSSQPPVVQPSPAGDTSIQADPQADAIEQSLTDLDSQLKSVDTLDDFQ